MTIGPCALGRLWEEHGALKERIDKLQAYVISDPFFDLPEEDQVDLREQLAHMQRYYAVLIRRLARYTE